MSLLDQPCKLLWAEIGQTARPETKLVPDADQLARQIMPLGEPVKALTGNVLRHHLPLELDAVRTLFDHGFHLSKAQHTPSTC